MAAGNGRALRLNQVDKFFCAFLSVGLQLGQQLVLQADHILNGGSRRAIERAPRAAIKRFVQMDMHVAHRREHQLAACVVVRQRGVGVAFVIAQRDDFTVFDLQRF
ncbi:hypothetical protein D3C80_1320940 [compost metagenome]